VELTAPLSANLNHKSTAFGGSLSVIAITSGWSLLFMRLQDSRNEIVIQESHMTYLKAVKGDFSAISTYDDENPQWSRFIRSFERHGKGRIMVASNVYCYGELVAQHSGTYVAFKK
jgi:thioesterase domain-containing protein